MKPVEFLIEATKDVQGSLHSEMHNGLEGDVETNPETLMSHMQTIQAELDSLHELRDCLNEYLMFHGVKHDVSILTRRDAIAGSCWASSVTCPPLAGPRQLLRNQRNQFLLDF